MKTLMKALPLIALLAVALPPEAGAQSPEEKGLEIAREMDRRDRGWGTTSNKLFRDVPDMNLDTILSGRSTYKRRT